MSTSFWTTSTPTKMPPLGTLHPTFPQYPPNAQSWLRSTYYLSSPSPWWKSNTTQLPHTSPCQHQQQEKNLWCPYPYNIQEGKYYNYTWRTGSCPNPNPSTLQQQHSNGNCRWHNQNTIFTGAMQIKCFHVAYKNLQRHLASWPRKVGWLLHKTIFMSNTIKQCTFVGI